MKDIYVFKIGGNIINHPKELRAFLLDFSTLNAPKILIHGGGRTASEWSHKMGIKPHMIDGRRVTDEQTLKIVTMIYAGLINKNIIARLQADQCQAIGLTGADLNIIPAQKRKNTAIDYGFVGDFRYEDVEVKPLLSLLDMGVTPVFCAITHNQKGDLLNTNADTIASNIAIALSTYYNSKLIYCFEKKGVLSDPENDNSYISYIDKLYYENLKADKIVTEGMIPKLDNCFYALENGVHSVCIGDRHTGIKGTGTLLAL